MTSTMLDVKVDRDDPALLHEQVAAQLTEHARESVVLARRTGNSGMESWGPRLGQADRLGRSIVPEAIVGG